MKMMYRMYECRGGQDARERRTQDVREYAEKGMQEMSVKFVKQGSQIYKEV
jgi:hypothetical protein